MIPRANSDRGYAYICCPSSDGLSQKAKAGSGDKPVWQPAINFPIESDVPVNSPSIYGSPITGPTPHHNDFSWGCVLPPNQTHPPGKVYAHTPNWPPISVKRAEKKGYPACEGGQWLPYEKGMMCMKNGCVTGASSCYTDSNAWPAGIFE